MNGHEREEGHKIMLGIGVKILRDKTPKGWKQNKMELKRIKGEYEKDWETQNKVTRSLNFESHRNWQALLP